MQISATVIAAQQAAREAQTKFQTVHFTPAAAFAAAMEKEGFAPLTLPKPAAPAAGPAPEASPAARPGSLLDIKI
ncbi:MAG TPA: hypothetical protein VNW15_09135 [Rhizomicrobium sp.]|jgi:hypothetical protein|nr:hypothetical protein [Rhizomicrobium sp.]